MTPMEEGLLQEYIYKAYELKGITSDNDSIFIPGTKIKKEMPVLEDVYNLIEDVPELRNIRAVMTKVVRGSLSCYNKTTNVNLDNKYIVFDLGGKEGEDLSVPMYIVLDYVWGRIKENKLEKKAVFIDEAWQLIGSNSNVKAAEFVQQIFKTIRAFGGAAFVMTQQVKDFFALGDGRYGTSVIDNCNTKILLGMAPTDLDLLTKTSIRLTAEEQEKILKQKRGQGMLSTGDARLFVEFKSSPYEHKILATNPDEIKQMAAEGMLP
jgi:type IV secretory pathway VirB4 component